jgi:anaerobic ribonucleoside-triphosphate reductase activating protein
MFQVEAFTELANMIKKSSNKTIWCYTGYTYEEIKKDSKMNTILPYIDVLVDGRFIIEKRNTDLKFRGSENQRIIHLKDGEIEWIEE